MSAQRMGVAGWVALVAWVSLLAASPAPATTGSAISTGHTFAETGFEVAGRFWDVWQGGRSYSDSLFVNGFPIMAARAEVSSTDGKTYPVQWFERARFEQHPENQSPYDVLLGLLGTESARGRGDEGPFKPVTDPGGDMPWFRETQHTLGDGSAGGLAIARCWTSLGGLRQFGFPLSQPFAERSRDDGKIYLVQYFERQRFEWHPENAGTRYEVLLGRLGVEQLARAGVVAHPTATTRPAPSLVPTASPTAAPSPTPVVAAPGAPRLISPPDGCFAYAGSSVSVEWGQVAGAEEYYLDVQGQGQSAPRGWTGETAGTVVVDGLGSAIWRVMARNVGGEGAWSEQRRINIYREPLPPPGVTVCP